MNGPRNSIFRAVPAGPPAVGFDADPAYGRIDDTCLEALELGPRSEIDQCLVRCPSGNFVCAVGSPVVGPLEGPFEVVPYQRIIPFNNGLPTFRAPHLVESPPLVEVVRHFRPLQAPLQRRAAAYREITGRTLTALSSNDPIFEMPVYGRKRCTVSFYNSGANPFDYSIQGVTYTTGGVISGGESGGGGGNTTLAFNLALNSAGATSLTLAAGAQVVYTFYDESFDTLLIVGSSVLGTSVAARARTEDDV